MYLVLRGTPAHVRKPDGRMIEHVCKRDVVILDEQAKWLGANVWFEHVGFTLIVHGGHLRKVHFRCPGCGRLQ